MEYDHQIDHIGATSSLWAEWVHPRRNLGSHQCNFIHPVFILANKLIATIPMIGSENLRKLGAVPLDSDSGKIPTMFPKTPDEKDGVGTQSEANVKHSYSSQLWIH